MKICLIGNMEGNVDEGMKKVTFNIYNIIKQQNKTLLLNPYNIKSVKFWKDYINFRPEIVHYLTGPSVYSFFLVRLLTVLSPGSKSIITASHPNVKSQFLIKKFKINRIVTHSNKYETFFKTMGFNTKFIPNGVDLSSYKKISKKQKEELREKYSIPSNKFVVLHVGNILKERNISILDKFQTGNNQVLIVGSTSIPVDDNLRNELKNSGCLVYTHYIEKIHEIYQLSDCYIFPTVEQIRAIEIPLSVLEAMACNLPVISTRFGGLPSLFTEGKGLFFIDSFETIDAILSDIKSNDILIDTVSLVKNLSWENIGEELNELYRRLKEEI